MIKLSIAGLLLILSVDGKAINNVDKKVVCYYINWSSYSGGTYKFHPKNIDPFLCTHLIYSYVGFKEDLTGLEPADHEEDIHNKGYKDITDLKRKNKDLKVLAALGGWNEGSKKYSDISASKLKIKPFVQGVVKFLRDFKFDGINIDWQFPGTRPGSRLEDKQNFVHLLKTLKQEFEAEITGQDKLIIILSVPPSPEFIQLGYDLPKLQKYADLINNDCYDYHLSTDPATNHPSPIYALPEEDKDHLNYMINMDDTIKYILKSGVPREKLLLGIPVYGRTYTLQNENENGLGAPSEGEGAVGLSIRKTGTMAYFEICQATKDKGWNIVNVNKTAMGPYAYNKNNWVAYDDTESAKRKGEYARDNNLAGIFFWTVDDDDFEGKCGDGKNPLINAAKSGFLSGQEIQKPIETSNVEYQKPSDIKPTSLDEDKDNEGTSYVPKFSSIDRKEIPGSGVYYQFINIGTIVNNIFKIWPENKEEIELTVTT